MAQHRTDGEAFHAVLRPARRSLICAAALLAGLWTTALRAGEDSEFREVPKVKVKESKPKKDEYKKTKDGWTDPNYQAVDSLGKIDGNRSRVEMGPDANLSPDELHAKYMKHLAEQREKMAKLQAEMLKKEQKRKEKEEKERKENPGVGTIIPGKNARIVEMPRAGGDAYKNPKPQIVQPTKISDVSRTVELKGRDGKNAVSITDDKPGEGVDVIQPGGSYKLPTKTEPPKRGFWDKLLGRNKPPANDFMMDDGDGRIDLQNSDKTQKSVGDAERFMPKDLEYRSTATQRLREVLSRKRDESGVTSATESEKSEQIKKAEAAARELAQPDPDAGAELVSVPGGKESAKANDGSVAAETLEPPAAPKPLARVPAPVIESEGAETVDAAALPETDYDVQAEADRAYAAGLRSKDIVLREAAYQRAGWERRLDAIPFLMEEVRLGAPLCVLATEALSVMPQGEHTPALEALLMRELVGHDPLLRKACADALGRQKSRKALPLLAERIKPDRNPKAKYPFIEPSLPARSACVEALGAIGERDAIEPLKSKLEEPSEVEFVKSRAALALARLGDPSGRAHLIKNLDSSSPAMQVMGLNGLAQLNDPSVVTYLGSALESRHDEVWTTAVFLFPRSGPATALPLLRQRLLNGNEITRRRVALAMGFLGSDDGITYIDRAVRFGTIAERVMGCELLANLARTDCVPLLIEKLQDPSGNVRMNAAVALTRLNATEAIGAITESSRTRSNQRDLPPWMRANGPDVYERLVMLSCVRILRGEKDDLVITTLPDMRDNVWPEVDRVMGDQQVELLKLYEFVDVIASGSQALGVVLRAPNGQEMTYRSGEPVAGGFKIREIGIPAAQKPGAGGAGMSGYVTLVRGDERVTLAQGKPPTVDSLKRKK